MKGVIKIFVEEWYLVESGAESVLQLGIGSLHEEDMLVLVWQFFREADEGLLVGLLVGERILFEEVKMVVGVLLDDGSIGQVPDEGVLPVGDGLAVVALTHEQFKYIEVTDAYIDSILFSW